MLGMSAPVAQAQPAPRAADGPTFSPTNENVWDSEPSAGGEAPPKRTTSGWAVPILVVGLSVALLGVIGLTVAFLLFDEPELEVSVVQVDRGDALGVRMKSAPDGTKVRVKGVEQALQNGMALFPLSADDLAIGENELNVEIVEPSGSRETVTVQLVVSYRVRADVSRVSSEVPVLAIVIDALPGSKAVLDGRPVELDGAGRGSRDYPIDPKSDRTVLEHTSHYRLELPSGQVVEGDAKARVPYATLQIESPGSNVITDRQQIDVRGAVDGDARVFVGGREARVEDGHFSQSYSLPGEGDFSIQVLARRDGRVSTLREIPVRKVSDLAREAAKFQPDPDIDYEALRSDAATYQGKKVVFVGSVYHTDLQGGRAVAQMLVAECPADQRCPLWVTHSGATPVTPNMRVRVLGFVAGEQQFRSTSGEVRSVPRVDALFVLPTGS
jgi:hypothetical protein